MGWWAPERLARATLAVDTPANIPRPGYFRRRAGRLAAPDDCGSMALRAVVAGAGSWTQAPHTPSSRTPGSAPLRRCGASRRRAVCRLR